MLRMDEDLMLCLECVCQYGCCHYYLALVLLVTRNKSKFLWSALCYFLESFPIFRGWPKNFAGFPAAYAFFIAEESPRLSGRALIDGISELSPSHIRAISP